MFKNAVLQLALLCAALPALNSSAGEDAPQPPTKPWRPYPELGDVLFYEDFENVDTICEKGKVTAEAPAPPGGHCFLMSENEWGKNEKSVYINVPIKKTPMKVPGGMKLAEIFVQFMVWGDELSEVTVKFKHAAGDYEDTAHLPKEKTWVPIMVRFSELHNKNGRPEPDQVCTDMEIIVKPRDKKKLPKIYLDDIIITGNGVKPADVFPRLQVSRKAVVELTRIPARDGFSYSPHSQELLKAALKAAGPRRKTNGTVIMGSRSSDADDLAKAMTAAAAKMKATGLTFASASAPDGPPSGVEDMRLLLNYNIQKESSNYTLLALGFTDATRPGRPSESVRVVLERTLGVGAIPIVILAPVSPTLTKDEKTKVDTFNNGVSNVCLQMGVTMLDPNIANKAAKEAYDKNELSAAGLEAVAALAAQTVKHIDTNLYAKK